MISSRFLARVQEREPWPAITAALPSADALPLFKMLAIQSWLDLSDEKLFAEVEDRMSLRRFCAFGDSAPLPGRRTLADFRDELERTHPVLLNAFISRWPLDETDKPLLSVVSPVYRAEQIVEDFVRQVTAAAEQVTSDFEIILVEDGSRDGTWLKIAAQCAHDSRVKGIKLSRNFGQHFAITAGLEHAHGAHVVVLDCDLQDDPAFIPQLHAKACEGYEVVLTEQSERAHSFVRRTFARAFARTLNWLSGETTVDWLVGGYSILSRRAVEALLRIGDVHRHYLGLVRWLGFPIAKIRVAHRPRLSGRSSYNLKKLLRHAIDGWVSQSNRLLYISVALGFTFLLAAVASITVITVLYFVRGFAPGWPSLVVLILTCTGSILISLGVVGIYIGKIFDQVRGRPLYIIERTLNEPSSAREPAQQGVGTAGAEEDDLRYQRQPIAPIEVQYRDRA
jgi:dolichol-phosphate mannosyltransferase